MPRRWRGAAGRPRPTMITPSRTACRTASWCSYIRVISAGPRPCVWRRSRLLTRAVPPVVSSRRRRRTEGSGNWSSTTPLTRRMVMPAETSPTTVPSAAPDRDHGLDEGAYRPGDLLGDDAAGERGLDVADEFLADAVGHGVGVADAVGVQHDDEVDLRAFPGLFGAWLEHLVGRALRSASSMPGALAKASATATDRSRARAPRRSWTAARRRHGGGDEQQHDHHLQEKDLAGDSSHLQNRTRAAVASGHVLFLHLPHTVGDPRDAERSAPSAARPGTFAGPGPAGPGSLPRGTGPWLGAAGEARPRVGAASRRTWPRAVR